MRADDVHLLRGQPGPLEGQLHALGLPLRVGQHEVGRVGVHRVPHHLAVDAGPSRPSVAQTLQHEHASALGHHNAVAVNVEGAGGPRRIVMFRQRPLAAKTGEDPKRVDALRNAAGQRHVAFVEPQHLRTLNHPGVARRTGRTNRVVRAE